MARSALPAFSILSATLPVAREADPRIVAFTKVEVTIFQFMASLAMGLLEGPMPLLLHLVVHVVLVRPQEQMTRIHTRRVVASVEYLLSARDRPKGFLVG